MVDKVKKYSITFLLLLLVFNNNLAAQSLNRHGYTRLEEGWDFYLHKGPEETFRLLQEGKPAEYREAYRVSVPHYWNSIVKTADNPDVSTYGSYHYKINSLEKNKKYALFFKDSPGTSSAVYVNGNLIAQTGNPFEMLDEKSPQKKKRGSSQVRPLYCEFSCDLNGTADIVIFVSNYFYRKGGLWDTAFFGEAESILHLDNVFVMFYSLVSGILIFIGLLNLLQFLINKKGWEYFYLGITSIVFALRVATAGYSTLTLIFPFLPSEIEIKLEYMVLWLAPLCILKMLYIIYPAQKNYIVFKWLKEKAFRHSVMGSVFLMGIISLIVPAYYANRMVPYLQVCFGIIALYVVVYIIINIIRKSRYIYFYLTGYALLILGGAIDIVYTKSKTLLPLSVFPFFVALFVFVQIILLAIIQNDLYKDTVRISSELQKLNESYLRFVPREFIKLLHKDSVTSIKAGDYADIEMCIIFSKLNIRYIQGDEKDLALDRYFLIFNEYLKYASPIIKKHGGFVSKFLSGGFMALFPSSEKEAVYAALEINDFMKDFALSAVCKGFHVTARSGIHYGKMIAGTLGEAARLDDTVISDTVNTSSRIESVCERLNKNIIISQALEKIIEENSSCSDFDLTELESIYVKGKEKPLQLFEVRWAE
ncbi:MAG: adenylate/guanylate cyclase domain-containing protein [Treponema sp.]|nr:adenylate/guanylate cyclase domain-containing protein [Treponema sp.]